MPDKRPYHYMREFATTTANVRDRFYARTGGSFIF